MSAKHLQAGGGGSPAVVGDEGLDDGGEHGEQFSRVFAYLVFRVVQFLLQQHRTVGGQGAAALSVGAGSEQHFAHIGVHDDRVSRLVFGLGTRERSHLDAVFGIGQAFW